MEERHTKLRKVFGEFALPRNVSFLDGVLRALANCSPVDLDELLHANAYDMSQAMIRLFDRIKVVERIQLVNGKVLTLPCVSFAKVLPEIVRVSPGWRSALKVAVMAGFGTNRNPLGIVVWGDEIIPGNILEQDHARKSLLIFFAIKEFGPTLLQKNASWVPVVTIRSNWLKIIPAGMSGVFRVVYRRWFLLEMLSSRGVPVHLESRNTEPTILYFALKNQLLDGDALRAVNCSMGAKGKVPCIGCLNVLHHDLPLPDGLESLACTDSSKFQLATNEDIWGKVDRLRDDVDRIGVMAFKRLQTASGLKHVEGSMLLDEELRPHVKVIDILTLDAMHCLFSNGIVGEEFEQLLTVLLDVDKTPGIEVTWSSIHNFMQAHWCFPSGHGSASKLESLWNLIREERFFEKNVFSPTASECLLLLPVLGHLLDTIVAPRGVLPRERASYAALRCVVSLVREGKTTTPEIDALDRALRVHADAFIAAYGVSNMLKPHWSLHIPSQLRRDGFIMDAFVGERVNQVSKRLATEVRNTRNFEESCLQRHMTLFMAKAEHPDLYKDGLIKPEEAVVEGVDCHVSLAILWNGLHMHRGDIVFVCDKPMVVQGGIAQNNRFGLIVYGLTHVSDVNGFAGRWRRAGGRRMIDLRGTTIRTAAAWYEDGEDVVILRM